VCGGRLLAGAAGLFTRSCHAKDTELSTQVLVLHRRRHPRVNVHIMRASAFKKHLDCSCLATSCKGSCLTHHLLLLLLPGG
jgi:hypothetical protein